MNVSVVASIEPGTEEWSIWRRIQSGEPALASPYFRPEFTAAVAAVRSDVQIGMLRQGANLVGFFPFQRNKLHMGRPVGGPLSDYHGLICPRNVQCLPEELLCGCGLVTWDFDHLLAGQTCFSPHHARKVASPTIDLSDGFGAYRQQVRRRGSGLVAQLERKMRKFRREVGLLRFEPHVAEQAVLRQIMAWKSAQCHRSGTADVFGRPWTVGLLERIHAMTGLGFSGMLSALYYGNTVVAAHFGMRSGPVLHWWFPSFDRRFQQYSPGLLLLLKLMEQGAELGIHVIDLGKGEERYKLSLMNGATLLAEGCVERPSLISGLRRVRRATERWMDSRSLPRLTRLPGRMLRHYERRRRYR